MKNKQLKLIMELIFIFIIPLVILCINCNYQNTIEYDNNGNYQSTQKHIEFTAPFSYVKEPLYINYLDFNQKYNYRLLTDLDYSDYNITITNNDNGSITFNGTPSAVISFPIAQNLIIGHKYYIQGATSIINIYDSNSPLYTSDSIATLTNSSDWYVRILNGYTINETIYFQVVDLTQMFGSGYEPTSVHEYKDIMTNVFYDFTISEVINYESNSIISENNEINYTIWGKLKNILIENLQIQDNSVVDIIISYTILWFIMFVVWHFFYLFFDGLVHLFVDWKKRSD